MNNPFTHRRQGFTAWILQPVLLALCLSGLGFAPAASAQATPPGAPNPSSFSPPGLRHAAGPGRQINAHSDPAAALLRSQLPAAVQQRLAETASPLPGQAAGQTSQANFTESACSTFQLLKAFGKPPQSAYPYAGLMQGTDGALYGTAYEGGSYNAGTVFKLNPDGTGFTVLKSFDSSTTGSHPFAELMQGADGALYGTAYEGGSYNAGTVFKLNPDGTGFAVILNFDSSTTGANPFAGVIQGMDGALYGTAPNGGTGGWGTVFKLNPNGTGFTVLHNFDYETTGGYLQAGLMQGTDGALYGTASYGGSYGAGTVFRLNPDGSGFTVLQNFDYSSTGGYPLAELIQGTDDALYGTASEGAAAAMAPCSN